MTKNHTKKVPLQTPEKKETLGSHINKMRENTDSMEVGVNELINEAHRDYDEEITKCVDRGRSQFEGDFFISILHKVERLAQEVNRFYYIPRISCPTPTYNQTVYKYHRTEDMLEFLWTVPDEDVCQFYKMNALQIDPEEKELLNFVLDFYDGALDIKCKQYNGEKLHEPRITIKVDNEHEEN